MKRLFPIALIASLCLTACSRFAADEESVVVLYTSDIHGNVLPFDFTTGKATTSSMAHIYTYVDRTRQANPDGVILLDGGDLAQGNPAMYYYNYVAMRTPHLAARAVNALNYDAIVFGNHDLDAGPITYIDRLPRQCDMPILGANAIDTRTGDPLYEPYTIVERKGYRFAVIGFLNPAVYRWLPKSVWPNLNFNDMITSAEYWLPIIREKEKPDFIVGVFHAGTERYDIDEYNRRKPRIDGALQTIQHVAGFDLALLGHSHEPITDFIINDYGDTVHVLQPSAHAEEIGRADIRLHRDKEGKAHCNIALSRVRMDEVAPDRDFIAKFDVDADSINSFLDNPLGYSVINLEGASSLTGPSTLIDLVHTVQLDVTHADISLASALSTFSDIPAGPISRRQIFAIYKYENQVHTVWMTGAEVHQFLEWGYARQFNQMRDSNDYVLGFKFGQKGEVTYGRFGPNLKTPQYNFTSAAGINYSVDISKPEGERVTITSMADGTPFKPERKYTVALNSYQASGGGGFTTNALGWTPEDRRFHTINESTKDMCFYISNYIREHGNFKPTDNGHWCVQPQMWWARNHHRDIDLLLPYLAGGGSGKTTD